LPGSDIGLPYQRYLLFTLKSKIWRGRDGIAPSPDRQNG
jgi:hypothetical protein